MTMHRPSNVDSRDGLEQIIALIDHLLLTSKVVFPVHPRTLARLREFGLLSTVEGSRKGLILTEPKDYFTFQRLISECRFVVTDSGGIQEETTFRGIPCFTLRPNTERPSTITHGTNVLVTNENVHQMISERLSSSTVGGIPPLWDGSATQRVIAVLDAL